MNELHSLECQSKISRVPNYAYEENRPRYVSETWNRVFLTFSCIYFQILGSAKNLKNFTAGPLYSVAPCLQTVTLKTKSGECQKSAWMLFNCKKECNFCWRPSVDVNTRLIIVNFILAQTIHLKVTIQDQDIHTIEPLSTNRPNAEQDIFITPQISLISPDYCFIMFAIFLFALCSASYAWHHGSYLHECSNFKFDGLKSFKSSFQMENLMKLCWSQTINMEMKFGPVDALAIVIRIKTSSWSIDLCKTCKTKQNLVLIWFLMKFYLALRLYWWFLAKQIW